MIDMSNTRIPLGLPVVVAVDGSRQSVHAAVWAAEEAIDRDAWLRLVYVEPDADTGSADAQAAFDSALDAIEAAGRKIRTECQIRRDRRTDRRIGLLPGHHRSPSRPPAPAW